MRIKHDTQADAAYIYLSDKPYEYGVDFDDDRRIDYGSGKTPIGVELLNVSKGVNLHGLPNPNEIAEILRDNGIRVYELVKIPWVAVSGSASNVVFEVKLGAEAMREQPAHSAGIKQEVTV